MVKQKVYLLSENLGQLRNLNMSLEHLVALLLNDIYSSSWLWLLKQFCIILSWLNYNLPVVAHVVSWLDITQFVEQVWMGLISQLINSILRALQKLLKYINGAITLKAFFCTIISCWACYFLFKFKWSTVTRKVIKNISINQNCIISMVLP